MTQKAGESPTLSADDFSVTYGSEKSANKTDVGEYEIWVTLSNPNFKFKDLGDDISEKMLTEKLTINQVALELDVSGSDITYGQTLSESKLSGKATISGGTEITGNWAWDEAVASSYPTVSKDSGKTEYTVRFTPTSSSASNFTEASLSKKITIKVKGRFQRDGACREGWAQLHGRSAGAYRRGH